MSAGSRQPGPPLRGLALAGALTLLCAGPATGLKVDDISSLFFVPGGFGFAPEEVSAIGRGIDAISSPEDLWLPVGTPQAGLSISITQDLQTIHQRLLR